MRRERLGRDAIPRRVLQRVGVDHHSVNAAKPNVGEAPAAQLLEGCVAGFFAAIDQKTASGAAIGCRFVAHWPKPGMLTFSDDKAIALNKRPIWSPAMSRATADVIVAAA